MATEFISNSWLMPTNANAEANRVSNYSLDFDGSSQSVDTNSTFNTLTSFSISAWFKADDTAGTVRSIVSTRVNGLASSKGLDIYISANVLTGRVYDNGATEITQAFTDTSNWHNVVMTYNGTTLELFLDNSSVGTATGSYNKTGGKNLTIGKWGPVSATNYYFNGKITEVSIFDYALSASQVTQLYGTGSAIGNPMAITNGRKPVAYYPLGNAGFNGEFLVPNSAEQDYVFSFDDSPSNNAIDFGVVNAIENSTSFTLNFWLNPSSFTSPYTLLGTKTGFSGDSAKGIAFDVRSTFLIIYLGDDFSNYARVNNPLPLNEWTLLSVVYDGSQSTNADKFKIYYGGTQQTVNTFGGTIPATTPTTGRSLILGKQATGACIETKVSNFSVFDSALPATGSESVESLYNYGTPPNIASWSNLQGWWELDASATFDGSNWSIPDASSNSNTGTSSNMTAANLVQSDLIINAPFDSFALDFDGSNDFIDCGSIDEIEGITTMSISGWFNPQSSGVGGAAGIIAKETRDWYVGWYSSPANSIRFLISSNDGTTKDALNSLTLGTNANVLNKWHHFVCSWDASDKLKIYINGVLSSETNSVNATSALPTSTNIVEIGRRVSTYFDGKISNCSIYSSVLSATQVKTLYNEGKPFDLNNFEVTPVSWWRLGSVNSSFDGSNWTVLDEISTSGNNGTSANMTQSDLVDGIGATGSGTSSGMSSGTNRTGNSPYSDKNSVSYNMSVTAKSTSVPT